MATCLVVEDAPGQAANLVRTLQLEGHEVAQAGTLAQALASCRELQPDVVLLDLGLPDGDGLDAIPELIRLHPLTRVVVLTGRDSVKTAVAALRAGARHYLVKPWDNEELLLVVEREARSVAATATLRRERSGEVFWSLHPHIVRLQGALEKLSQAAFTTVLLEGETGSGKEIVARELHRLTAAGGGIRRRELRCGSHGAFGKRAIRARARFVHRRGVPAKGACGVGHRRHSVPR